MIHDRSVISQTALERMRQALRSFILDLHTHRMRLPRLRSRARLLRVEREKVWQRHRLGTVATVDMSWAPKISSARTAGHRFIRQRRYPRPRRTYPFLLPRNSPAATLPNNNRPKAHKGRGPD